MIEDWEGEGGFVAPVEITGELVDSGPGLQDLLDVLMIQTALLMRLYDVNMRVLESISHEQASQLWDLHDKGGHENPQTMVPSFERENDEDRD